MIPPSDREELHCAGPPRGVEVNLPGSKSIANRALLLAALAEGRSRLTNVPPSDDVARMLAGLRELGSPIELDAARGVAQVAGVGGGWRVEAASVDCGGAGTVLRFLTAAACLGYGDVTLDGDASLRARPLDGLVDALRQLGARIAFEGQEGRCPVVVHGCGLRGGTVRFGAPPSSQFISAVMMCAPHAADDVFVEVAAPLPSRPYVEMTRRLMEAFGVGVMGGGDRFIVPSGQRYRGRELAIEPDATAASYFLGLAGLTGGSVVVRGVRRDSLQGDWRMLALMESMGCSIVAGGDADDGRETITVRGPADGRLGGIDVSLDNAPDLAPTLAVMAAFACGPTRLRGIGRLRFKESDRLTSLAQGLLRLGAEVEIDADGLTIRPAERPTPAAIDSYDDHRIAMAFTLASARMDGVVIRGASCVAKSFPGFFEEWRRVSAPR